MKTQASISLVTAILATGSNVAQAQVAIPEPTVQALAYHQELFWLWLLQQVLIFALPLYLLFSGNGASIAHTCMHLVRERWIIGTALFASAYAFLYSLVRLPVDYLRTVRLNPYHGLDDPNVLAWLADQALPILVLVAAGAAFGWIPVWLIRKTPRGWWAWSAGAVVITFSAYLMVQPLLDDQPDTPINESQFAQWQERIDKLARKAGLADLPVVVRETDPDDSCGVRNSVIGAGPTQVVVLSDQVLARWEPAEVDVAVAHEIKHYLFDNGWFLIFLLTALCTAGSITVLALGTVALRLWSVRFGFSSLGHPAAIPLLVLCLQVYMLVAIPVFNRTAQHVELEADRFALELTRQNEARARVSARRCGTLWLPEDTLFDRLYRLTHPSVATRIHLANTYRPWETNEPLEYSHVIEWPEPEPEND